MKRPACFLALFTLAAVSPLTRAAEAWRTLFNGKDLSGWKANAYPDSWSVVDGAIRARATKESSHLFFVGPAGASAADFERFKDFELEVVARSEPNSNGGVFIHTDVASQGAALRLTKGYEIQLNSSEREKRKTGSLYDVVDLDVSPVDESKWFTVLITVRGKRIQVQVEGRSVVDYTEPENVQRAPGRLGRKLDPQGGAIALQAHDPTSTFYIKSVRVRSLAAATASSYSLPAPAAPPYFQVHYAASTAPGGLAFPVTYRLWIPPGVTTLRGVIVHQHGCGEGACRGGETAADDLHWQALARKWDCALLGPSYQQPEGAECARWCDPRNGSGPAFLRALGELGQASGHPELERVPWALWGHSGGATWAGTMLQLHPERVAAAWLRSGAPQLVRLSDTIALETPAAALLVPVMANPGAKEKTHERFYRAWDSARSFFTETRAKGGLVGFAPDPRTSHECGDSRYLAIPFFDACLAQRLPDQAGGSALKPMNAKLAWLAPLEGDAAHPAAEYAGSPNAAVWLPTAAVAQAWSSYVQTGATPDATPPPSPTDVRWQAGATLTWNAAADFESGLGGFIIERDGAELARLPDKPIGQFGRPLFQRMSYHDTPARPLPATRYTDTTAQPGVAHSYRVISINSVGLRSEPSATVRTAAASN